MPDRDKRLRRVVKALFSIGLLAIIFSFVPLDGVSDAMLSASWDIVVVSLLVMCVARYVKSIQMHVITRHLEITLSSYQIFKINLITMFYGLFLPGAIAGGAVRWYHLSSQDKRPAEALAAIILSRVLETSMLICLGFGFWLIDGEASEGIPMQFLMLLAVVSMLIYLLSFSRRVHAVLFRLTDLKMIPEWASSKIAKVLSALGSFEDLPRLQHVKILLLSVSYHVLGLASLYLLAVALQLDVDMSTLGWIRSVVAIAMLLPVSIAGLGVREAAFLTLLIPYGVASGDALALSLLVFARGLAFSLAGSFFEAKRLVFGQKEFAK